MIKGASRTEGTYRANMLDSSSSLKDFSLDRKKYYKKYILGESVAEKENAASNMGRMVETLLLEPEEFDGRFYLSHCATTPTGLMLDFVLALFATAKDATNEKGVITRPFEDMASDAYKISGFKLPFETVLKKFVGSDAEIYYRELCSISEKNLTVVTPSEITFAERIVEELKTNFVTKDIINTVTTDRYEVVNQLQVEPYIVQGYPFKSMIDKIIVDHHERTIDIYDLKCTWNVENFYEEYYLYRRSYIQAYLYFQAVKFLTLKASHSYYGYTVNYPKFIVCDSGNYNNPLIYEMSTVEMLKAQNGFEYKGRTYPGVVGLIESLKWAVDNNLWNISKENYDSNGIVQLM